MDEQNPFYRPEKPKNSLELLKRFIFHQNHLGYFDDTLSEETVICFLKAYSWVILISILYYLIIAAIITGFNLPLQFPTEFEPEILKQWNNNSLILNFKIFLKLMYIKFIAYGLSGGMIVGLIIWIGVRFGFSGEGIERVLVGGLILEMIGGLTYGLSGVMSLGLSLGLTIGMTIGLIFGLAEEGVIESLKSGMAIAAGTGLILTSLKEGRISFKSWEIVSSGILIGFILSYFRFIFYPFYLITGVFNASLTKNVYLKDAMIWLPIYSVKPRLLLHSWANPNLAFQFADFLLEYRPLQRKLAFEIIHTATAATWYHHPLFAEKLILPRIDKKDKKAKQLLPSEEWLKLIEKAKTELIAAEKLNHRGFKKDALQVFHQTLQELEKATLLQAGEWKHDYLKAIRRWLEESEKRLKSLELELKTLESVTRNKYRVGESLKPDEFGRETFLGREDSKNELSFRILASGIMPTFLLQGQRRVGKTSLLNFLPELLGSRFAVIVQDMQSSEFRSISDCLSGFVRRAGNLLKCQVSDTELSDDPLTAWQEFEAFFKDSACREERKIILAFDEYENFHKLLKQEGETGERLLAAMRSFSQHQNHIVFLFTGLMLFSDLGKPDFSEYFVHALRLKVDYLKKEDSIKLITDPYPEFRLIYPDELAEEMYRLTVGHPALLQHICFEMVNRANILQKRNMNNEDLQAVLELVLDRQNMVMINFWHHFCNGTMKETVREIMGGRKPQHKADVLRLLDYGFIIMEERENQEKSYKLRVPLFEQWIERHGESF